MTSARLALARIAALCAADAVLAVAATVARSLAPSNLRVVVDSGDDFDAAADCDGSTESLHPGPCASRTWRSACRMSGAR